MSTLKQQLATLFQTAIVNCFGADYAELDAHIQQSTQPQFGDYQANFAMKLAKLLKQAPRDVASQVVDSLADESPLFAKLEVSGPGFINIYLKDDYLMMFLAQKMADKQLGLTPASQPKTIVIDYGSANVAKEMHVGHIRSAVIGDALARLLTFCGHRVIRQNHLGDWGTQFGMLIQHMIERDKAGEPAYEASELNSLYQSAKKQYDDDADFAERARARVVQLQAADEQTLQLWQQLVKQSQSYFHSLYRRLGLLLQEEDDRGESFYNPLLKPLLTQLQQQGWVVEDDGALVIALDGFVDKNDKPLPYLVQKSDGGFLYATTDLAALQYRVETLAADEVLYVVDARQKQHFQMLFATGRKVGLLPETIEVQHIAFGAILGPDRKPFKTRSGDTIKLKELLDEAYERALSLVLEKNKNLTVKEQEEIATSLSISAIKYADLVNDLGKDYLFDWNKMLAFDGNTAPYLLNAFVRIQAIFRKLKPLGIEPGESQSLVFYHQAERQLALHLVRFADAVTLAATEKQPHKLCTYLYELAGAFHQFYEHCPVQKADNPTQQTHRLALCQLCARVLEQGLALLGIDILAKM